MAVPNFERVLIAGAAGNALAVNADGSINVVTGGSATQDVNLAQVAGATVATGHGVAAGTIRVELPTDGTGVVGLTAGTAIIGKVGIDQTTLGTTNLVYAQPVDVSSTSASATSAATLWTLDTTGYNSVGVQVTSAGSSCTITYEASADNATWVAVLGLSPASTNTTYTSTSTSASIWIFPKTLRYFRARVSTYGSGTVTAFGQMLATPCTPELVRIQGSSNSGTTLIGAVNQVSDYPSGATAITAASGNVANATAAATLAGVSAKTTYLAGFDVSGSGATLGSAVTVTVTGVITGTLSYTYAVVAGVLLGNPSLVVPLPHPVPASATNTAIVVSCPALGAGNTNATVNAYGYQL